MKAFFQAAVVSLATLLGYAFARSTAPAPTTPAADHSFYVGRTGWKRPGMWAGDDQAEVEVFRDENGNWVAIVWERGRCWQGKLTRRLK